MKKMLLMSIMVITVMTGCGHKENEVKEYVKADGTRVREEINYDGFLGSIFPEHKVIETKTISEEIKPCFEIRE